MGVFFRVLVKSSSFVPSLEPPGSAKRSAGSTFEAAPEGTRKRKELALERAAGPWKLLWKAGTVLCSQLLQILKSNKRAKKWGERSLPKRHKHHFVMVQLSISVREICVCDCEASLKVMGTQLCAQGGLSETGFRADRGDFLAQKTQ